MRVFRLRFFKGMPPNPFYDRLVAVCQWMHEDAMSHPSAQYTKPLA